MRYKNLLLCFLLLFIQFFAQAQDFSNKGKEFWLAYSYHVGMKNAGAQPTMTLYVTSDVITSYKVEIYGGATTIQSGTINAGQVVQVMIPNTYFIDRDGIFTNKAIRVSGDKPLVVYSYITRSAASAATLCLPTTVLGKEYYSSNFTQNSNEVESNSYITIVGVEDGTNVEITPTANTVGGWLANTTHTISLNKGEIYQVLGVTSGTSGVDLTGTKIKSVSSGSAGCKRIAVFSGSGKISIGCINGSADNLYQQLYPTGSWGQKYLTVPSYQRLNNYYRITKSDPSTNVYLNGVLLPQSAFNNNYYEFINGTPNAIEADKPISVVQYFTSQTCQNNGSGNYDPDMIVLNPVEQNIDKVTLVSTSLVNAPAQHHLHVIMHNGGTGQSSFRIDGAMPSGTWIQHPNNPQYSYLYLSNVTQGYHTLAADSGFNAIVYGYANAESYGYSAGANVKDLYQFVSIENNNATVNFPAACKASPFFFSMTFPYKPTKIVWQFGGLFPDVTISTPLSDSSWVVNGKTLYRYKLPTPYTLNTVGTFPIKVLAQNPTTDGCSGEQEINYDLQIFDRPSADFSFATNGCVSDSVRFADITNPSGRTITKWNWNFDDGTTGNIKSPAHLFTSSGTFNVKLSIVTDIGCISDTASKTVNLSQSPIAKFGAAGPFCINNRITFTDTSSASSGTLVKWYWDFGDGSPVMIALSPAPQTHTYTNKGSYSVSLQVESASGCKSAVIKKTIVINPTPLASFDFGSGCLPNASIQFTDRSTISDGAQAGFQYAWSFSDGGNVTIASPSHTFTTVGPFSATLTVTSAAGCIDDTVRTVNTINSQPQAKFASPLEVCLGAATSFTDQSSVAGSTVSQWLWSFDDGTTSNQQNPVKTFSTAGTHNVTLKVTSEKGCLSDVYQGTAVVNQLPVANYTLTTPTCERNEVTFTDHSTANSGVLTNWVWDLGEGSPVTNTSPASVKHTYSAAGNYAVKLMVTTSKGCTNTFTDTARVHSLPILGFKMPENCLTDPFSQFTDTSKIADGTQAQFSYSWNFGDPNATPENPNTATGNSPQHKYTVATNYNVKLTVTSGFGCVDSLTQVFTVNGAVPQSSFNILGASHCSSDSVKVVNNSSVDVGSIVKLEILWDVSDPALKTIDDNPVAGRQYAFKYPDLFVTAAKTYTIMVRAYSGDNCLSETTQTATVLAKPQIQFGAIPSICGNAPSFQVNSGSISNGTIVPGTFVYSGAGISSSGLFNPASAGVGNHTITYTYTGTNGCSNFKTQTIEVFNVPMINAGPDRFVLEGGTDSLLATANGNNLTYVWSPATWLSSATVLRPKITPSDDLQYTLTATSADGCISTDAVFVKVLKTPTIPNVFTPNGDGRNDKWEIQYLETYPGAIIEVYNRYGQIVFKSVGYSKAWDGTFNGNALPIGTYYYIINPKNGRKQIAGFVDIIR